MSKRTLYAPLRYLIAGVWLINGLLCKVLNLVPRHEQIVGRILGPDYAGAFTKAIGVGEVLMAAWVLSRLWPRLAAASQIILVLTMNVLEFWLVPDLLLWGRLNLLFAGVFAGLVYWHSFVLRPQALR